MGTYATQAIFFGKNGCPVSAMLNVECRLFHLVLLTADRYINIHQAMRYNVIMKSNKGNEY